MILVTDTASDILEDEAEKLGVKIVPITANFSDLTFDSNSTESFDKFYKELEKRAELPVSSQPSPDAFVSMYEEAKEKNEDVIVITVSSRISGTYNGAILARDIAEYDRVFVVDSLLASCAQGLLVRYAACLARDNLSTEEIVKLLDTAKKNVRLYGTPETLTYLKKGGRICPILADVGEKLKIKPVLALEEGIIECKKKVRGRKSAIKEMQDILASAKVDVTMPIVFGYSADREAGLSFLEESKQLVNDREVMLCGVGPAIGTHIGPNALLLAFMTV